MVVGPLLILSVASIASAISNHNESVPPADPNLRTVGILTMPPAANETHLVGHGHYITEMADIFMRAGGLYPVFIPYNSTDADLYPLLDQINGVYFTGGDLDLSDPVTGELHPYTVTAMKIYHYAMEKND